jgi:hypothetical protein
MEHPIFGDVAPYVQNDEPRKRADKSDLPPSKRVNLQSPRRLVNDPVAGVYEETRGVPFHGNLNSGTPVSPALALTGLSEAEARSKLTASFDRIAEAQAGVDCVNRARAMIEAKRVDASGRAARAEKALARARPHNNIDK